MQTKVVKLLIPAGRAVGVVDAITVPFDPKLMLAVWNGRADAVDAQGTGDHGAGVSLWTPAGSRAASTISRHGVSPSAAYSAVSSKVQGVVVQVLNGTGDPNGASTAGLAVDNGNGTWTLPLTCSVAYPAAVEVLCTLFGDFTVDFADLSSTANPLIVPTPSGPAEALLVVSGTVSSANNASADAALSIGFAARSGGQAFVAVDSDSARTASITATMANMSDAYAMWSSVAAFLQRGAVTAWNADNVQIQQTGTNSRPLFAVALIGCSAKVVEVATRTDLDTDIAVAGLGWRPSGVIAIASGATAWDAQGVKRNNAHLLIGTADATLSQGAREIIDVHGANPTVVASAIAHDDLMVRQTETAAPTPAARMRMNSVNTDGLTLRMSLADDAARPVALLVLGPDTGVGAALSGGTIAAGTITPTSVEVLESVAPGGGTAPYSKQLRRSPDDGTTNYVWANVNGQIAAPYTDTTAAPGTKYAYLVEVTDSTGVPVTENSNILLVETPALLVAGVATLGAVTASEVQAGATAATGGTAPISYQWQRTARGSSEWANVAGQIALALSDKSVLPSTDYDYRLRATDTSATPQIKFSNTVQADVPEGTANLTAPPAVERVETIPWGSTRPIEFELTRTSDGLPYTGDLTAGDAQLDPGTGVFADVVSLPVAIGGRYRWTPSASETAQEAPVFRVDLTGTLRRLIFLRTEGHPNAYYGGAEAAATVAQNAASGAAELRVSGVTGTLRVDDEVATSGGATARISGVTDTGGGTYTLALASPGLRGSAGVGDALRSYLAVPLDKQDYALSGSAASSLAETVGEPIATLSGTVSEIQSKTDALTVTDGAVLASLSDAAKTAITAVLDAQGLSPTVIASLRMSALLSAGDWSRTGNIITLADGSTLEVTEDSRGRVVALNATLVGG